MSQSYLKLDTTLTDASDRKYAGVFVSVLPKIGYHSDMAEQAKALEEEVSVLPKIGYHSDLSIS